jgi:hypothetical protein
MRSDGPDLNVWKQNPYSFLSAFDVGKVSWVEKPADLSPPRIDRHVRSTGALRNALDASFVMRTDAEFTARAILPSDQHFRNGGSSAEA